MAGFKNDVSPEISRLFIQCKNKDAERPADLGAYLRTSRRDGHVLIGLDGDGLARQAHLRDRDVIVAVNDVDFKVEHVPHRALVECFRYAGTTLLLLIQRSSPNGTSKTYFWISFRLGRKKKFIFQAKTPVIVKQKEKRVGHDLSQAKAVRSSLPKWTTTSLPVLTQFQYHDTVDVRVSTGQTNGFDMDLGFFSESTEDIAKFSPSDFVIQMHKYNSYQPAHGGVVAFSTRPPPQSGNNEFDVKCIGGASCGLLRVLDFPSYMRNANDMIPMNERFFRLNPRADGSIEIKAAETNHLPGLYVWKDSGNDNMAILTSNAEALTVTEVFSAPQSLYPNLSF